jgi:hypothetical protein
VTTPDQPTDPYRSQPDPAAQPADGTGPAWNPSPGADQPPVQPYGQPPVYGEQPQYGQAPAYGQPPAYGDPYAQQQPYGQQPYGQQPYGQQPYGQPSPDQHPAFAQPGAAAGWGAPPYVPVYGYPKNSLGVWSLVLGIVSLVCFGPIAGIPAIITGVLGRKAAARGEANNGGLALAGIILGAVGSALWVVSFAFGFAGAFMEGFNEGYAYSSY